MPRDPMDEAAGIPRYMGQGEIQRNSLIDARMRNDFDGFSAARLPTPAQRAAHDQAFMGEGQLIYGDEYRVAKEAILERNDWKIRPSRGFFDRLAQNEAYPVLNAIHESIAHQDRDDPAAFAEGRCRRGGCGADAAFVCGRCKLVRYCSRQCQKACRKKSHKATCFERSKSRLP